ncbi:MAG: FAD-dependent oxidoreductase, partial [Stenotrophobium sp.]
MASAPLTPTLSTGGEREDLYDVCIIGGGLVGASLAVALAPLSLRVALIEASAPPQGGASWDERCIAINDAS